MPTADVLRQIDLLKLALAEQQSNNTPGRTPSSLAINAYVDAIPSAGEKDAAYQDDYERRKFNQAKTLEAETHARLSDPLEAAKAAAGVRDFQLRRNVREAAPPLAFTPENFGPVASHAPTRKITRNAPSVATPTEPRAIRRYTDAGGGFTDPDAAMGLRERTALNPSVVAAGIAADSRESVAGIKDELKKQADAATQAKAQQTRDEVNRLAQELHDDPSLAGNVGVLDARTPTIRGGSVDFQKRVERLKALLSLESRGKLKGQGAISDMETRMLANSATSLDYRTDENRFRTELQRIMQATAGHAPAAAGGASGEPGGGAEYDFVDGKLVPR